MNNIAVLDVYYTNQQATAAVCVIENWSSANPIFKKTVYISQVLEYAPGNFYKRELPCLLLALEETSVPYQSIVIDGYVHLGSDQKPGLGMHLWLALKGKKTVTGVAKRYFLETPKNTELLRGDSQSPLFITAQGLPLEKAKNAIASMDGKYRIPTILKMTDTLSRCCHVHEGS
jgi:deoxyribonuclease V